MAKNIDFMGATFPDVPSIRLPQHEGGLVSFDDTSDGDIVASDVAQGKIGYAQGQRVVGTATPSTPTIQSLSVTENGTYTAPSGVDGYSPVTVNVSGGTEVYPFYHKQLDIPNTTSTTPVNIEEVSLPQGWDDDEHLLYFISTYVGDVPPNHYIGSEITGIYAFVTIGSIAFGGVAKKKNTSGQITRGSNATAGVIPWMSSGKLSVRYLYSANVTYAIGGTYDVKMYLMPKSILKS